MNYDVNAKESLFNEAILKMKRIDFSWQIVNNIRTNLLDFNEFYNKWNYEVMIGELITSCQEIRGKMKPEGLEDLKEYRNELQDLLEDKPIYVTKYSKGLGVTKQLRIFSKENWKELRKLIFSFEDFTRDMQEKHGFSGSSKKDPTKAILDF